MRIYRVGGCVRDELLGVRTKDIDYAVEAESFDAMKNELHARGFKIFLETPKHLTIRARFPKTHKNAGMTADFVLCRKDGPSSDHRRPDYVEVGTIYDDLARRDFTVNAMAIAEDGTLLDPHDGQRDLGLRILRFVGDPMTRIREDALRALRGLRFMITKDFASHTDTWAAINDPETAKLLLTLPTERVYNELKLMFETDTIATLDLLNHSIARDLFEAIFCNNDLRLTPAMGGKVRN